MVKITWRKSSSLHQNFPFPCWEGRFIPYPCNVIWKTLASFTFQSRGIEIVSTHFSVWLWNMTHFNTPKNEMNFIVLLVIENGFLIPTWKYWNWTFKEWNLSHDYSLKGCWLLFYQSCVWACHLVLVRKILTSLLDKCKKMT